LKGLDYFSDEDEYQKEKKQHKNKFLEKQDKARIDNEMKRRDKHLLPVENFYIKNDKKPLEKVPLPYSHIDLIFNHKNIWANL
jgi:hypothetical protein